MSANARADRLTAVEMTNMCMVYDSKSGRVLVQQSAPDAPWQGVRFPGGHVEDGESVIGSTIREVKEETGLTVSNLKPCGIIHWYNTDTRTRYIVFQYKTDTYSGDLVSGTDEGTVFWTDISTLPELPLSHGMRERLPMFLDDGPFEGFGEWNERRAKPLEFF